MLANMVESRRREEEEAQREAERLIAKRKKFKEVNKPHFPFLLGLFSVMIALPDVISAAVLLV